MTKILEVDGVIYTLGKYIMDLVFMSLLWFLFILLGSGLTIGASTNGLFYAMRCRVNGGMCNFKVFFIGFKKNFLLSNIFGIIMILMLYILLFNITHIQLFATYAPANLLWVIMIFQWIVIGVLLAVVPFLWSQLSSNRQKFVLVLFSAFNQLLRSGFVGITSLVLLMVLVYGSFMFSAVFVFGIGGYALLSVWLIIKSEVGIT